MSKPNLTYQPVLVTTITATEDIPAYRFVNYGGDLSDADEKALGVSEIEFDNGETGPVIVLGTAILETSESVAVGDNVSAGADGKGTVTTATEPQLGRALTACTGAGFIVIKIVP